ncbi:AraC family transcriptional regulator [Clostridium thermarum]|uniref:AraC family transcriptional regulator n=1 Tax=Clostridium thermarum TaxID=1716543 RepID=UPI0013D699D6|nr:AraC family transcriptional regulator [Clostridium thermarum]
MESLILYPVLHKNIANLPFYVTGLGINYLEGGITRKEGFQDYQWAYCIKGSGRFIIENKTYVIPVNSAFFFRKDIPHQYFTVEEPWVTNWITFNGAAVQGLLDYMNIGNHEVISLVQRQDLEYIMEDIFSLLSPSNSGKDVTASSLLYKFLIKMKDFKDTSSKEEDINLFKKLQPVINLMAENYNRVITLDEMADKIEVSKHYLCRIFKKAYLVTPFQYLNQLRIQKSKEAMMNNKLLKIKQVAYNSGFSDVSYFCSMFKKIEGCTPIEFKKTH